MPDLFIAQMEYNVASHIKFPFPVMIQIIFGKTDIQFSKIVQILLLLASTELFIYEKSFLLLQEPGVVLTQTYQKVWHLLLTERKELTGCHVLIYSISKCRLILIAILLTLS
jgi:hypothetical protein